MTTYLAVYAASAVLAALTTPLTIRLSVRLGLMDKPGVRKVHASAVPRIGGVAIFTASLSMMVAVLFLNNSIGEKFRLIRPQIVALLVASSFMFLVGLVDDIRGLRARTKLLAQILAAAIVCGCGIRIVHVSVADYFVVDFGWMAWPITILWIVGITNAVNLIDGLDGLAAGISAITCAVIGVLAWWSGEQVMLVLMLALLGSLTGFLPFNFHPARAFMGDCGSLLLGFLLASSSVLCTYKSTTIVGLALPALALGIPIFDTLLSMLRRILERRSMAAPDRGHIHHRLLMMGLSHRHTVLVLYMATLGVTAMGMLMMITRDRKTLIVLGCTLTLLMLFFRVIGSVRLHEALAGLRRNMQISHREHAERTQFENAQLLLREALDFDDWFDKVCAASESLQFTRLSMNATNRDGTTRRLVWRHPQQDPGRPVAAGRTISTGRGVTFDAPPVESRPGANGRNVPNGCSSPDSHPTILVTVPVQDRRAGCVLKIEVAVPVNGSLESAGRRLALFSRLMDECSVARLDRCAMQLEAVR